VAGLRTEFPFTLPKGFVDASGTLHRHGTMRLATARDEIEPLRDRNVTGPDDPYLTILVLARVVNELGSLDHVTPTDVENFFAADLAFLQDLYGIINFGDPADVEALQASVLPDHTAAESTDGSAESRPHPEHVRAELFADELMPDDADDDDRDSDDAPQVVASARRRGHIEEVRRTGSP
jgi:hypothetical protein